MSRVGSRDRHSRWASLTIQIKKFNPTFLCISRDIRKEKIKQEHKKSMNDLQKEEQKMKQDETEYDDLLSVYNFSKFDNE